MRTRHPSVDAYIAESPDFARPILTQIRDVVHAACPDVEESIKWGCPHFTYHGMLCGMAAFKQHCRLHFWRGEAIVGDAETVERFHRIESVEALPARAVMTRAIRRAMELNVERTKSPAPAKPRKARPALPTPPALASALGRNSAARKFFETMAPSHRRDYIEWITEARTEPTREKRIATAVEWLAEGKSRNWKYERKGA
jgi:hypothetical protein